MRLRALTICGALVWACGGATSQGDESPADAGASGGASGWKDAAAIDGPATDADLGMCNSGKGGIAGAYFSPEQAMCLGRSRAIADKQGFPFAKSPCAAETPKCVIVDCTEGTEPLFCCKGKTPVCSSCPEGAVSTGTFCIDAHEITRGQYETWLAQNPWDGPDQDCMGLPEVCQGDCVSHPQVCVTSKQADAFCAARGLSVCNAGHRAALCGPAAYPYAGVYDPTLCNGKESGLGTTASVGSYQSCGVEVAHGVVFDLSGNVAEWGVAQEKGVGPMGGGFVNDAAALTCEAWAEGAPAVSPFVGFRCCSAMDARW